MSSADHGTRLARSRKGRWTKKARQRQGPLDDERRLASNPCCCRGCTRSALIAAQSEAPRTSRWTVPPTRAPARCLSAPPAATRRQLPLDRSYAKPQGSVLATGRQLLPGAGRDERRTAAVARASGRPLPLGARHERTRGFTRLESTTKATTARLWRQRVRSRGDSVRATGEAAAAQRMASDRAGDGWERPEGVAAQRAQHAREPPTVAALRRKARGCVEPEAIRPLPSSAKPVSRWLLRAARPEATGVSESYEDRNVGGGEATADIQRYRTWERWGGGVTPMALRGSQPDRRHLWCPFPPRSYGRVLTVDER